MSEFDDCVCPQCGSPINSRWVDLEKVSSLADFFEIDIPTMDQVKAALLKAGMRKSGGNIQGAAEVLGVPTKTAYNWLKRYPIVKAIP